MNYVAGAAVITHAVHRMRARDAVMPCAIDHTSLGVNIPERKGRVYTHVSTHPPSKLRKPRANFVDEAALRQCIVRLVH